LSKALCSWRSKVEKEWVGRKGGMTEGQKERRKEDEREGGQKRVGVGRKEGR
jgi:hypothetical protein